MDIFPVVGFFSSVVRFTWVFIPQYARKVLKIKLSEVTET
jgi:hypothetical protein